RRVEDVHVVGGADDEDQLLRAEAVHLGQQLVDHRVLDAAAGVGAAGAGEGVQLVEDDDRRGRLAGTVGELPGVFLALPPPPPHRVWASGPLTTVRAAPMDAAIALAKKVLPVPGGPQKIRPRGKSSSSRVISSASVARSLSVNTSRISLRKRSFTFL